VNRIASQACLTRRDHPVRSRTPSGTPKGMSTPSADPRSGRPRRDLLGSTPLPRRAARRSGRHHRHADDASGRGAGGWLGCLARSGPPRHLDLGSVNTLLIDLRLASEVDRDPHGPADLDDSVPCPPVAAVEHVGPVVRRSHERPKDGPDGWPLADVLSPAATARRPREGAVEEPSALRHPDRLPLGRRPQTRAPDEPRQVMPEPRGVGHRREASLPPVERRRRCSEHEHANEGDRERAPHERLRRNRTSSTCTQRDGPSWTKRSHRQPPLGSEGAMQPIVDLRLSDVYRVAGVRIAQ
jgi:hypothetical protein